MPGRSFNSPSYRYGFNGKEKDDNLGGQTSYDYGFRIYNPGIGKFLSVDPLSGSFSELTPYQFASNRPIDGVDLEGLEWVLVIQSPNISSTFHEAVRTKDIIEQRRLTYWALNNVFPDAFAVEMLYRGGESVRSNQAAYLIYDENALPGVTVYTTTRNRNVETNRTESITFDASQTYFPANKDVETLFDGAFEDRYYPVDTRLYDSDFDANGGNYYGDKDFIGVSYSSTFIFGGGGGTGLTVGFLRGYGYQEFSEQVAGGGYSTDFLFSKVKLEGDYIGSDLGRGYPSDATPFNFAGIGSAGNISVGPLSGGLGRSLDSRGNPLWKVWTKGVGVGDTDILNFSTLKTETTLRLEWFEDQLSVPIKSDVLQKE